MGVVMQRLCASQIVRMVMYLSQDALFSDASNVLIEGDVTCNNLFNFLVR